MAKGSDGLHVRRNPIFLRKGRDMKKAKKGKVVASRKSCKVTGAGLSHYILMDKKAKKVR